jgi:hypothetical protein
MKSKGIPSTSAYSNYYKACFSQLAARALVSPRVERALLPSAFDFDPDSDTCPLKTATHLSVSQKNNGVSALGLQRVLGLKSYETALTWLHKLLSRHGGAWARSAHRPGRRGRMLSGRLWKRACLAARPEESTDCCCCSRGWAWDRPDSYAPDSSTLLPTASTRRPSFPLKVHNANLEGSGRLHRFSARLFAGPKRETAIWFY